jgi:hypothetical protein
MGNVLGAINLQGHGLASRETHHIQRWVNAQLEGRRAMPKCAGIKYDGERCTHPPLRGFDKCRHHLRGVERDKSDREREARYLEIIECGHIPIIVHRARRGLAAIARRRFNKMWDRDPRIEGSTIEFTNERDRQQTIQWLIDNCGVDISQRLPGTSRLPTPCCVNRMLWPAWRIVRASSHVSEQAIANAKASVARAIRADIRFWERWDEAGGDS